MLNVGRLKVLTEVVGSGLVLRGSRGALLHAIRRLAGDRAARGGDRHDAGGARPPGVRPTAAGATLVEHAETIFAQIDAAETDLAAVLGVRIGRLRMASFPSAGATLMPLAIATFREAHPDVTLTLAEGEPEEIAPRLRAGEFDLALLFEFPGVRERPGAGVRSVSLLEDPMHVALPAAHPLADKRALTLADLRDARLGADVGVEPVRPARRAVLPRGGVRAAT